jgi:hypothetical protein
MPKLSHKQLLIFGGVAAVALLFLWYRSHSAASSAASSTDPSAGDYTGTADDSGAAELGGDIQAEGAQEQSDVSSLQSALNTLGGAEGTDATNIANLQTSESGDASNIAALTGGLAAAVKSDTTLAGKVKKLSATLTKDARTINKQHKEIVAVQKGEKRASAALKKATTPKHTKTGHTKTANKSPHVNANHPAGTAGRSVAARSHAAKTRRR